MTPPSQLLSSSVPYGRLFHVSKRLAAASDGCRRHGRVVASTIANDTTMIEPFTTEQVEAFRRDGFLIVEEGLIPELALEPLRERYLKLFDGEYETGIRPDEVNWVPGRDPEDRTRQLCNAWKADTLVAAQVLSERVGRLAAQLMGYRGVRILQDNVLWKPPGTKAIGFHQDSSYADYLVPPEMVTCWMSLHDTQAGAGPLEFVPGSHTWPKSPPERTQFHAPDDWLAGARAAAPEGTELETVPVVVKAGGGSFHHGLTWHGSAPNTSGAVARMALVSHFIPVETRFHETNVDVNYSRYRRRGDLSLDESFFPVIWDETGYRTPWLAELPSLD
jgi:ectoine hydroxylase-related dioxygenase (phytanoyl-CoA dioxygenase family)